MSSKDELKIEGFSNFLGAISYILQTVDGLKKSQPNSDIKDLETQVKLDLSNVPLMLRLIKGQIQNFLAEYILDHEFQKAGYEALLAEVDKTRQILNEYKFSLKETRLKHLDSIEAIINKEFKEIIDFKTPVKLRINASKSVIYDLFRSLKPLHLKDEHTQLLSQPNREIAVFIYNCIEGFETTSIATIENQLNRPQIISKDKILIKKG